MPEKEQPELQSHVNNELNATKPKIKVSMPSYKKFVPKAESTMHSLGQSGGRSR